MHICLSKHQIPLRILFIFNGQSNFLLLYVMRAFLLNLSQQIVAALSDWNQVSNRIKKKNSDEEHSVMRNFGTTKIQFSYR